MSKHGSRALRFRDFADICVGYMEEDLMEIDLKSIFRAISSLENWIMI